jgi:hypothetical protein
VNWVTQENIGDLFMEVGGLVTPVEEHVSWIKPKRKKRPDPAHLLRAWKLYVRKMAKEFGWKIKSNAKNRPS